MISSSRDGITTRIIPEILEKLLTVACGCCLSNFLTWICKVLALILYGFTAALTLPRRNNTLFTTHSYLNTVPKSLFHQEHKTFAFSSSTFSQRSNLIARALRPLLALLALTGLTWDPLCPILARLCPILAPPMLWGCLCSTLCLALALWGAHLLDRSLSPSLSLAPSPAACDGTPQLGPSSLLPKSPGGLSVVPVTGCHLGPPHSDPVGCCLSEIAAVLHTGTYTKNCQLQKNTSSKNNVFSNILYHSLHSYSFQHLLTLIRLPWY